MDFIKKLNANSHFSIYPSYSEISDFVYLTFSKSILPDTLRNLLRIKTNEEFKTCVAVPLDQDRYFSTLEDIKNNLKLLKEEVEDVPSNFVFNVDEVGHSEYADSTIKKLLLSQKNAKGKQFIILFKKTVNMQAALSVYLLLVSRVYHYLLFQEQLLIS